MVLGQESGEKGSLRSELGEMVEVGDSVLGGSKVPLRPFRGVLRM